MLIPLLTVLAAFLAGAVGSLAVLAAFVYLPWPSSWRLAEPTPKPVPQPVYVGRHRAVLIGASHA